MDNYISSKHFGRENGTHVASMKGRSNMKGLSTKLNFSVAGTLAHRRAGRAFTLIELLVVIAIIALLLSIIIPAVNLAKRKAATAVCLVHAKHLAVAWFAYQDENHGKLVNGNIGPDSWVDVPQYPSGAPRGPEDTEPVTDDDEKRGIMKGTLYPYLEATDVMHCPADNLRKSKWDQTNIFRTYSIPRAVSSGITKFVQISQPGVRYNFVEEADARNWNFGTWDIKTPLDAPLYAWEWQDVIAVNHGDSSILGFCDGHAEVHKWQDDHTKERLARWLADTSLKTTADLNIACPRPPGVENDLMYMASGWAYRGR